MQVEQIKTNIISSTGTTSQKFNIQASAHAFNILSDKLYQDKVLAVVREYFCNAFDAHQASNQNRPIDIHVPTELEEFFSVRDYGTGCSKEDVLNYYTTYFASDKNHSNEAIGGFGLGCKAAFSYQNTFTVTSWFEGTKTNYILSMIDGIPTCIETTSTVSEEPSGLLVQVAVKDDAAEFRYKLSNLLRYFPSKSYRLSSAINITEPTKFSKGVYHNDNASFSYKVEAYVVMGNVEYPFPFPRDTKFIELFKEINNRTNYIDETYGIHISASSFINRLVFEFDIGELPLLPSREAVEVTDKAKVTFINKVVKALDDLIERLRKLRSQYSHSSKDVLKFIKEVNESVAPFSVKRPFEYWCFNTYRNPIVNTLFNRINDVDFFYQNATSLSINQTKFKYANSPRVAKHYVDEQVIQPLLMEIINSENLETEFKTGVYVCKRATGIQHIRHLRDINHRVKPLPTLGLVKVKDTKDIPFVVKAFEALGIPAYSSYEDVLTNLYNVPDISKYKKSVVTKAPSSSKSAKVYQLEFYELSTDPNATEPYKLVTKSMTFTKFKEYVKNKTVYKTKATNYHKSHPNNIPESLRPSKDSIIICDRCLTAHPLKYLTERYEDDDNGTTEYLSVETDDVLQDLADKSGISCFEWLFIYSLTGRRLTIPADVGVEKAICIMEPSGAMGTFSYRKRSKFTSFDNAIKFYTALTGKDIILPKGYKMDFVKSILEAAMYSEMSSKLYNLLAKGEPLSDELTGYLKKIPNYKQLACMYQVEQLTCSYNFSEELSKLSTDTPEESPYFLGLYSFLYRLSILIPNHPLLPESLGDLYE